MSEIKLQTVKKYKLLAPEGGWGYVIWIAVIINLTATTSFCNFRTLYKLTFTNMHMSSTSISMLDGIGSMSTAIAGLATYPLLKIMSLRQLALLAAFIYNVGIFSLAFVKSQILFILCYGFMQSFGVGLLYNISCTILNAYFVKNRLLAISITQTAIACLGFFAPNLIQWSIETYGHHGTIFLISGLNMHTFLAAIVMQPVALHKRKVEISANDSATTLLFLEENMDRSSTIPIVSDTKCKSNNHMDQINNEDFHTNNDNIMTKTINYIMDVALFKKYILSNACLGLATCTFLELIFAAMLPHSLYDLLWSDNQVAWAVTAAAFGDLITRILFIILNKWLRKISSHKIYIVGLIVAFVTRIGMLGSDNITPMLIFIAATGVSHCTIMILVPLVVAEAVGDDKFTSAMGIYMMIIGLFNLVIGPGLRAIKELTNSYATAFYIIASGFAIVILFWTVEIVYKKNMHKMKSVDD